MEYETFFFNTLNNIRGNHKPHFNKRLHNEKIVTEKKVNETRDPKDRNPIMYKKQSSFERNSKTKQNNEKRDTLIIQILFMIQNLFGKLANLSFLRIIPSVNQTLL